MQKAMRTALLLLGAVFLGGVGGNRISHRGNDDATAYVRRHPYILSLEAENRPKGEILVVGDSIVERSGLNALCGKPVFNAGVSSARLADVDAMTVQLVRILRPSETVIQIGANDVHPDDSTPPAEWRARYEAMIRQLHGTRVVLVPAPAIQPGKANSATHDPRRLATLNAELTGIAARTGATLLSQPMVDTMDGVHLSPKGVQEWQSDLQAACIS